MGLPGCHRSTVQMHENKPQTVEALYGQANTTKSWPPHGLTSAYSSYRVCPVHFYTFLRFNPLRNSGGNLSYIQQLFPDCTVPSHEHRSKVLLSWSKKNNLLIFILDNA